MNIMKTMFLFLQILYISIPLKGEPEPKRLLTFQWRLHSPGDVTCELFYWVSKQSYPSPVRPASCPILASTNPAKIVIFAHTLGFKFKSNKRLENVYSKRIIMNKYARKIKRNIVANFQESLTGLYILKDLFIDKELDICPQLSTFAQKAGTLIRLL